MKRFGLAMLLLCGFETAYGQNTLPEVHMFFSVATEAAFNGTGAGGLTLTPANFTAVPSLILFPNTPVSLAVWIRALPGDTSRTTVTSYNYEIAEQTSVPQCYAIGGRRQRDLGGSYVPTVGSPVAGNPSVTYND